VNLLEAGRRARPSATWALIDQIYAAGADPQKWPLLLEGLVSLVACHPSARNQQDRQLREVVTHHLDQALHLNTRINQRLSLPHSLEPMIDNLAFPLVVIDREFHIAYRSRAHSEVPLTGTGVRIKDDRLTCASTDTRDRIASLFEPAPNTRLEQLVQAGGVTTYGIALDIEEHNPLVMVVWFSPQAGAKQQCAGFAEHHQLTSAETDLLAGVVEGRTYTQLADLRCVSAHTVQSQIKQIFTKVGVHSRTELTHRVLSGCGLIARASTSTAARYHNGSLDHPKKNQTLSLSDGDSIGWAEYGPTDGLPILLAHNISGSRFQIPTHEQTLHDQQIRLIVPDRPGIGLSSGPNTDAVVEFASGVDALLNHLALDEVHLIGHSIGAVYAMGCAHALPGRFRSFSLVSPMVPIQTSDMDGLNPELRGMIELVRRDPTLARKTLALRMRGEPREQLDRMISALPPVDQILYREPGFYQMAADAAVENACRGPSAMINDLMLLAEPRPFQPSSSAAPSTCWHGELDITSPTSAVQRFVQGLPECTLHLIPGETHNLLFRQWHSIIAHIRAVHLPEN